MIVPSIIIRILLLAIPATAAAQDTQSQFWPQSDLYINLDSKTRLLLRASFNNDEDTRDWQGDFGLHLDFALKPVFRRELRQREDVFNRKYLSFRAGFRYITSLGETSSPYLEHRWLVELTARYPLPEKLVLIDRHRGEMRFISRQAFSSRYRNKLQLERDFRIRSLAVFTPYVNGELFYDTRYDIWNRNRYSVGAQVPLRSYLVLDTYFLRQNDSRSNPPHVNAFGLTFNFYF